MIKKHYIYLVLSILAVLVTFYTASHAVILSRMHKTLYDAGFEKVDIDGFGLYADGAVLKNVTLDDTITLKNAYVHAYTWQWLNPGLRRFYIQELNADISGSSNKPIIWPFILSDIINIETINVKAPLLDDTITFTGSLRKPSDSPFIFNLKSENKDLQIEMKTEIHATDGLVHVLDIELQDATVQKPAIQTKRMFGWLSFSWDTKWQVIGEIESGFLSYDSLTAFNNNLKLNGPLDKVDFSFAAHLAEDQQPFILDRNDDQIITRSYDEEDHIEWSGLNSDFVKNLEETLNKHSARHEEAEYLRTALDTARSKSKRVLSDEPPKKPKTIVKQEPKTDLVEAQPVLVQKEPKKITPPQPSLLIVEDRIIPKITFNSLIDNTLFAGFHYTRSLAVIPHSCGSGTRNDCWTARAQGGHLGYGIDGVTPRYFAQIKNIAEARILRNALRDVAIERLTVKGRGKITDKIIIQGSSGGEPIYIELTVSDLE